MPSTNSRSAVDWIDDPHGFFFKALAVIDGLFGEPAAVRAQISQGFFEVGVGLEIRRGQRIVPVFVGDLKRAAEVLQGQRPGLAGGCYGLLELGLHERI